MADQLPGEEDRQVDRLHRELSDCRRQLQRSQVFARTCLEASPQATIALDREGRITAVNEVACCLLRRSESELLQQIWFECCLPQPVGMNVHLPAFLRLIGSEADRAVARGDAPWMGAQVIAGRGQICDVSWQFNWLTDESHRIDGVVAWLPASGETLSADEKRSLAQERFLLQALMNHVPDHVYFKDRDSRFIRVSQSLVHKVGLENQADVLGKTDFDFFSEEHARQAFEDEQAVIQTGRSITLEERETWNDRPDTWSSTIKVPLRNEEGIVVGTFGISRDITDRRQIEADVQEQIIELTVLNRKLIEAQNQLLQAEKMASIGQLAAGVAHEINNPIGYINSNLNTLKGQVGDLLKVLAAYRGADSLLATDAALMARIEKAKVAADIEYLQEDVGNLIDESLDGVGRVRKIVDNLKDFSRADTAEWHFADIEKGLESTLNIVWNEIKYKAEVKREYAGLPEVECIASQLNQVFLNLLINAAQAIDAHGQIILRTGFDAHQVWVEVEDNGKGIRPEHMKKIFEPFFTTKPVGKGTGLGLSLAYGIIESHHGKLEVQSKLGYGTTFRVTIPRLRVAGGELE